MFIIRSRNIQGERGWFMKNETVRGRQCKITPSYHNYAQSELIYFVTLYTTLCPPLYGFILTTARPY